MSKVNTSCFEQELQMEYYFDNDIESNHTDESIEYYKKKNVVMMIKIQLFYRYRYCI